MQKQPNNSYSYYFFSRKGAWVSTLHVVLPSKEYSVKGTMLCCGLSVKCLSEAPSWCCLETLDGRALLEEVGLWGWALNFYRLRVLCPVAYCLCHDPSLTMTGHTRLSCQTEWNLPPICCFLSVFVAQWWKHIYHILQMAKLRKQFSVKTKV